MSYLDPTSTLLSHATATLASRGATCTTAVPGKDGWVPPDACNANYGFHPSFQDNSAFAVAFALTTVAHLAQAITFRKPFCTVIVMGALWECGCFVLRALGAKDQQNSTYVVLSSLLFLLAPLWINAFAYMILARLVYFLDPLHRAAGIQAKWLAKVFVTADIVSFIVQAAGGGMINSDDPDTSKTGRNIYMAGVSVQLVFVLIFLVVMGIFYRRCDFTIPSMGLKRNKWTRPLMWVVFAVLVLIVERIIFRLIEFNQGASSHNPILQKEAYQLYLDALPMLIALILLNLTHPGLVLQGPHSSIPSSGIRWWKGRSGAFEPLALQTMERSDSAGRV